MFVHLTNAEAVAATGMDELAVLSARKVNHGKFSDRYRGSLYRGVSKNGKAWQILIMIDNEKIYLCIMDNPRQAAVLYDYVIVQAKGLAAKLNSNYSRAELLAVLFQRSIVQIKKERVDRDKLEA